MAIDANLNGITNTSTPYSVSVRPEPVASKDDATTTGSISVKAETQAGSETGAGTSKKTYWKNCKSRSPKRRSESRSCNNNCSKPNLLKHPVRKKCAGGSDPSPDFECNGKHDGDAGNNDHAAKLRRHNSLTHKQFFRQTHTSILMSCRMAVPSLRAASGSAVSFRTD